MKRIDVTGGYYIDIDDRNWTLKSNIKEIVGDDGKTKETCTTHGYFGNLENAIKHLTKLKVIDKIDGVVKLEELKKMIIEAQKEISDIIKPLRIDC